MRRKGGGVCEPIASALQRSSCTDRCGAARIKCSTALLLFLLARVADRRRSEKVRPQQSGLELASEHATLRRWEDPMVEISVSVVNPTTAHGLVQRLARLFDGPSVSFDAARNEVRVRSEWESRSVVQVIDVVESWLASDGPASATLSVGDRTYTMHGSTSSGTPNRPTAA